MGSGSIMGFIDDIAPSPADRPAKKLENGGDNAQIVSWLKDRITEVEQEVDVLPSIAILVNHEDEVKPLADALSEELEMVLAKSTLDANGNKEDNLNLQLLKKQLTLSEYSLQNTKFANLPSVGAFFHFISLVNVFKTEFLLNVSSDIILLTVE